MAKSKKVLLILVSGNLRIGYKFIGPLTTEDAIKLREEIIKDQDSDIGHAELITTRLFSPDEARQEVKERGHLMSKDWLCIPRKL